MSWGLEWCLGWVEQLGKLASHLGGLQWHILITISSYFLTLEGNISKMFSNNQLLTVSL